MLQLLAPWFLPALSALGVPVLLHHGFAVGAKINWAAPGVVAALEKRFARKLNATVVVEPELIGGIRVVVGDEVMDTSVKARLEQMRVALTA